MKISKIRKTYFILSGIALIVIAFFIYMWFDTQRLAKALTPDSGTANKTDMTTNAKADQADPLKSDNPEVSESKPEENKNKTEETSKENESETKTVESPKTVKTDDWMFEKGENIEPEKTNVNKSNATSE